MKIAIVGSGISGLSAAYYLSKKHKVDLFEKGDHFGGHAYTIDLNIDKNDNDKENIKKIFNEIKVKRYCCRMRLTTYIDLVNLII